MELLSSWGATEWVILILSILGLFYVYVKWSFSYWQRKGVLYVQNPLPFFGSLKDLIFAKKPMGDVYGDMYKELKGNLFGGFFKFHEPAIMVCDPELIKNVMAKDFSSFHDNDIDITIDQDPMFGRNPFVLRGDRWKTVRSQLTPAFTPGKIKPLFPLINDVCSDLVKYLEKEGSQTDGVESKELAAKFTTDVVATCAYGINGNSFTDPKAEFREMGRNIMANTWWRNIQTIMFLFVPKLAQILKFRVFNEKVTNFFREVIKNTTNHRQQHKVVRNDFLQLLMQLKVKHGVKGDNITDPKHEEFTDEDVAAQALTFFTDGFETSATTMCFALYELAVNSAMQERLRTEVDAALERHDGKLSYEMLQETTYLEMVFAETLRKYPPGSFLTRLCTKPYDLTNLEGVTYRVEVGTSVAIPVLALHFDPEYFPDPERFDPERFTEDMKASRHPYTYLPFGGGPRLCLGNRFATTQVKAGIATIVSNFKMTLCKRTSVPIVFDASQVMPVAKDGVWIRFVKRTGK